MKLIIGCGKKRFPGAIHIDLSPAVKPDICADCGRGLPVKDNCLAEIVAENILEHLEKPEVIMAEIHRALNVGGVVHITVPHFSSDDTYADLTHKRKYSLRSFDDFIQGSERFDYYNQVKFVLMSRRIGFGRLKRMLGVEWLANRFPGFYESHLAFLFQAHHLEITLNKP